jgi:sugar phosphate isomerase/epimerase
MQRREFLKKGSLALAVPLVSSACASVGIGGGSRKDPLDRIAVATWSFRHLMAATLPANTPATARRLTALEAPRFVADELGLRQMEIIINHLDEKTVAYGARVREAADRAGVRIVNFQLGGNMSAPDATVRAASIASIKEGMQIAAALGAPTVRADVGGRAGEPLDLAVTADSYRQLADFGASIGVKPLIENHGGHSTNIDTLLSILQAVNNRSVRAILDWGNWQTQSQAERLAWTQRLVPFTELVSAKADKFDADYRTSYDIGELVRAVEAGGFRGKYSIEITTPPADIVRGTRVVTEMIAANLAA